MRAGVALVILGMAGVTYLTRAPLLLGLARRSLPPRAQLWLRLIPVAVLPALAVPLVVGPGGQLQVSAANAQLWGALLVVGLVSLRVNLLVTVAVGVAVVALLRAWG